MKSYVYRIRNGRAYSTGVEEYGKQQKILAEQAFHIVLESISKDIEKNINGKKIYIPENIHYTLPATEKQFTGYFPTGTYVTTDDDMVMGIHWKNVGGKRIDLDLSNISLDGKIGWDGSYRSADKRILFSGDMTDASGDGASELFYVGRQPEKVFAVFVNYYNCDEDVEVPFKIMVANDKVTSKFTDGADRGYGGRGSNYTINPNKMVAITGSKIAEPQKMLGLLVATPEGCKFYFVETALGRSISSSNSEMSTHARRYLHDFYTDTIRLEDVLEGAGAKIVRTPDKCDVDLSPDKLEKDTILNLLVKKEEHET